MKQLIFFFSIFCCCTFGVKIKLDTTNAIDNVQILENLFWNNDEDINDYLDLSDYRSNGSFTSTLTQGETENVTLLEEEAFSGFVSIRESIMVAHCVPEVTSENLCSQERSIATGIQSKSTTCKRQMVTY